MFNDGENVHYVGCVERSLVLAIEVVLSQQDLQAHFQSERSGKIKMNKIKENKLNGKQCN